MHNPTHTHRSLRDQIIDANKLLKEPAIETVGLPGDWVVHSAPHWAVLLAPSADARADGVLAPSARDVLAFSRAGCWL